MTIIGRSIVLEKVVQQWTFLFKDLETSDNEILHK